MNFFPFLLNPRKILCETKKIDFSGLFLDFMLLMFLNFIIGVTFSSIVLKFGLSFNFEHFTKYTYKYAVLAIFLAPIIEEFTFRAPLKPRFISLWMFLIGFYLIIENSTNHYIATGLAIVAFTIILLNYEIIKAKADCNINLFVYISSISFALLHISNLSLERLTFTIIILYSFPIFFAGLTYAYIRIRYNLFLSILLHSLYNSLPFLLVYFEVINEP